MSKKLQLSIPTPCHENWDNMSPVQQGKFCGSCQRQVVDFSNMNDRQVAEFFKKPSTGSVCGRFMTDQLDRAIEIPKKRIPWLKYFFQFAIPAFLFSIKASAQKTQGTVGVIKITKDTTKIPKQPLLMGKVAKPICTKPLMGDIEIMPVEKPVDKTVKGDTVMLLEVVVTSLKREPMMGKVLNYQAVRVDANVIKGKVIDDKGNPIPNASVAIKGTRIGISTSANGSFSITPLAGWDSIALVGSFSGYESTEVSVDKKNLSDSVIIKLTSRMMGELIICRKPPTKKELKNVLIIPAIEDDKHIATFKVFPNPVESGSSLNIEVKQAEEGYYTIQLLNQSGQSIHQQEIWIDAEARLLSIDVPAVPAGSYILTLINKKSGRKSSDKIIVQ
jgi:hypothetical protein